MINNRGGCLGWRSGWYCTGVFCQIARQHSCLRTFTHGRCRGRQSPAVKYRKSRHHALRSLISFCFLICVATGCVPGVQHRGQSREGCHRLEWTRHQRDFTTGTRQNWQSWIFYIKKSCIFVNICMILVPEFPSQ